jgi:hypothetical protein
METLNKEQKEKVCDFILEISTRYMALSASEFEYFIELLEENYWAFHPKVRAGSEAAVKG